MASRILWNIGMTSLKLALVVAQVTVVRPLGVSSMDIIIRTFAWSGPVLGTPMNSTPEMSSISKALAVSSSMLAESDLRACTLHFSSRISR